MIFEIIKASESVISLRLRLTTLTAPLKKLLYLKLEACQCGAVYSQSNWNLEVLVFVEVGSRSKTLEARTRTNNKPNPQMSLGPGIEPGTHWWKASALTTAPSLLPYLVIPDIQYLIQQLFTIVVKYCARPYQIS